MNRVLHFKQTDDQKTWVGSDTHLRHNNPKSGLIWKNRGYENSDAHTDDVINGINERARVNDNLIHFGDFCLNTSESEVNELLSRINCQNIYMMWGNHNNPLWRMYQAEVKKFFQAMDDDFTATQPKPDVEIYPFRWRNVIFIGNYIEFTIDGHYFVGAHYPIYVFNYMKDNAMHLCGHSHNSLPLSQADNTQSKILDVGWDGHKKILSLEEVLAIMAKKQNLVADHHSKYRK